MLGLLLRAQGRDNTLAVGFKPLELLHKTSDGVRAAVAHGLSNHELNSQGFPRRVLVDSQRSNNQSNLAPHPDAASGREP